MLIKHPFRVGFLAALGVLLALMVGGWINSLSTIFVFVVSALFLALGIDPLLKFIQRLRIPGTTKKVPAGVALLIVVLLGAGLILGVVFAIVPSITAQISALTAQIPDLLGVLDETSLVQTLREQFPWLPIDSISSSVQSWLATNGGTIAGGVLNFGFAIVNGAFGALIIGILTLYFTASLDSMKQTFFRFVPATKRSRVAELTDEITSSVGRYVVGQLTLAVISGIMTFAFLSIVGAPLPAVFALFAFIGSTIPLVGTISASTLIVVLQVLLQLQNGNDNPTLWIWLVVYYAIYMQFEAYVLSPNIMSRAVQVPGAIVVIAALIGGTLFGILGALIAIPVASSILLIMRKVVFPRQDAL